LICVKAADVRRRERCGLLTAQLRVTESNIGPSALHFDFSSIS
jgi:hypothetical protein